MNRRTVDTRLSSAPTHLIKREPGNEATLLQNSETRLPHLMNTSGFHQNVGEGHKSNVNGIRGSKMPLELMV